MYEESNDVESGGARILQLQGYFTLIFDGIRMPDLYWQNWTVIRKNSTRGERRRP